MTDPFGALVKEGFTYISFDLSRGVHVTAWHKNDRRTYSKRGASIEDAVKALLSQKAQRNQFKDLLE